jgi:hypothetical protein
MAGMTSPDRRLTSIREKPIASAFRLRATSERASAQTLV